MYNNCCVLSCDSRRKSVNLFCFPKRELILQKWLKFINYEQLRALRRQDLHKQFVCLKHFEKKFIVSSPNRARTRLSSDAYPTLFTENEISSGIPLISSEIQKVPVDHNYFAKRHYDHTYAKAISFENLENFQQHGIRTDPAQFMESSKDDYFVLKTFKTQKKPAPDQALLDSSQVENSSTILCKQDSLDLNDSTNSDNDNESLSEFITFKKENSTAASDHALLVIENSQVEMSSALVSKQKSPNIKDSTPFMDKNLDKDNESLSEFITFKTQNSIAASDQELLVFDNSQVEMGSALLGKQKSSDSLHRSAKNINKLVRNVQKMSPDCKLLYDENKKLRKRLKARKARKRFSKEQSFEKLTSKMSEYAKTLFWTQVKMSMKKKKGRRFTQQEKTFSLAILKKNPDCYRFLQQIFILPSRNTLKRLITQLPEPALNPPI